MFRAIGAKDRWNIVAVAERTHKVGDSLYLRGGGGHRCAAGHGSGNCEARGFMSICPNLPHPGERGLKVTSVAHDIEERRSQPVTEEFVPQCFQERGLPREAQAHGFVSGGRKGDKLGQANRLQ
jgi:hypothetical protein